MAPEMIYVDSSSIEAIGYDTEAREIYVQFIGGKTYAYEEVSEEMYQEFLQADSKGSWFNRALKPNYQFRQV